MKIHLYIYITIFLITCSVLLINMDNIFQLIDETDEDYRLDLAFVDEEILINYINNHNHIRSNFKDKLISNKLPPINFSVLGVCFHQSFLFITGKTSKPSSTAV